MSVDNSFVSAGVILILSVLFFSPPAKAQVEKVSTRIDSIAHKALDNGPIAGLSVAVVKQGKVLHAQGYGWADLEDEIPASVETIYVIASVTKLLTAAAAMTLVEAGRINLDDDLTTLLPEFPNPEQGQKITLRHLLSHTSGLHDILAASLDHWEQTGEPLTPNFLLEYLDGRPLDFEPGTHWIYSNTGVYLAGLIIERVSGQPFGTYVREALAEPLGLHDTFLCDDNLWPERRTIGYAPSDSGLVRTPLYETAGVKTGFGAAGGFCSTVLDLAHLPEVLKSGGLLSEASLGVMTGPTTLTNGLQVDYGLGVRRGQLDGHALWGHTGGNHSTWGVLAHYPDDETTIVVLVNTDGISENAWTLEGQIARAVMGLGLPRMEARPITTDALPLYAGRYEGGRGRRQFLVTAKDEQLHVALLNDERPATALVHLGNHTFGFPDAPMDRLVFHVKDGQAQGYSVYFDGIFFDFRQRIFE